MTTDSRRYIVSGYDEYGAPIKQEIEIAPAETVWLLHRVALWLCRRCTPFRWNLAYRLGLTKFRNVTSIRVKQ